MKLLETELLPVRIDILNTLSERDPDGFMNIVKNRVLTRDEAQDFLKMYMTIARDLLLAKTGCENLISNVDLKTLIKTTARKLSYRQIEGLISSGYEAENYLSRYLNLESIFTILAGNFTF